MAYAKIRPRRGTLAEWTMVNPIISEGELVIEHPNTGVGTGPVRFKIGDGFKPYNKLPYAFDALAANAIYGGNVYDWHDIIIRSDSYDNWMSEDPILGLAEITYDKTHKKIKVGDGVSPWSKLEYIGPDFNHGDYDFGDEDQIRSDLENGIPPKEPTPANVVYRPRRGKLNTIINPDTILRDGEMFFEIPPEGMGKNYCKVKIGDGVTPYSELHYAIDPWNCGVKDLPNEPLTFDDTLTNNEIDPLLDKIKSKAGMAQLIENIRACIVWLKTKHNELRTSYDEFYENVTTNYLTKDDAAKIYLTIEDAAKTYITIEYAKTNYVTLDGEQDISNKTYNGYTLDDACKYKVSDATKAKTFNNADGDRLVTERRVYFGTPRFNGHHDYDSNKNYYVHTTPGDSDKTYGEYISVSGANSTSSGPGPIWKNPENIRVGYATRAYSDWDGNTFKDNYATKNDLENATPTDSHLEELIKKFLVPNSLLTPLSFHRAVQKKRSLSTGEVGESKLNSVWFQVDIPNIQIPYVNLRDDTSDYVSIHKRYPEEIKDLNHSSLLLVTVQSAINSKGLRRFDSFRMDVLSWSPDISLGKYPTSDGKIINPRRKTIFTLGHNANRKCWGVKWANSSTSNQINLTTSPETIPNDIVYRKANIYLTAELTDTSVYVYRLDSGPINMLYQNMTNTGDVKDMIKPVGDKTELEKDK